MLVQNNIFTAEAPRTRRRNFLFGGEVLPNKKSLNPEGTEFLIQSRASRDWIRRKISLSDLCGSAVNLILGVVIILIVLGDAFETIILPRRVTRRVGLARLFYQIEDLLAEGHDEHF